MSFASLSNILANKNITFCSVTLEPCQGELDISIVDRISNLLNRHPICVSAINNLAGAASSSGPRSSMVSLTKKKSKFERVYSTND